VGADRSIGIKVAIAVAIVVSLGIGGCSKSKKAASSNLALQITSPRDGSSVPADRVAVRGTVDPPDATVQILGRSVQVGNGVFTGSVALHPGENTIDVVASASGSAPVTETVTVNRVAPHRRAAPKRAAPRRRSTRVRTAPPLSGPTDCGDGVVAGAHTSCPFARNVRDAYEASGSGILDVYSPTTGQTYRMYCTSGDSHVCTGGNEASVYFSTGGPVTRYPVGDCGDGLLVGPNTSCPFAANVRAEYDRSGPGWINVYSPVTGQTYSIYCTSDSPHVCTGGNNAAVFFE
jgi:Glucodextranase, domain B